MPLATKPGYQEARLCYIGGDKEIKDTQPQTTAYLAAEEVDELCFLLRSRHTSADGSRAARQDDDHGVDVDGGLAQPVQLVLLVWRSEKHTAKTTNFESAKFNPRPLRRIPA